MRIEDHSSAWNKHHGVGATLLDNWVEERAVGEKIIKERLDIVSLSKHGHSVGEIYTTSNPIESFV